MVSTGLWSLLCWLNRDDGGLWLNASVPQRHHHFAWREMRARVHWHAARSAILSRLSGRPPSGVSWRASSMDRWPRDAPQPGLGRSQDRDQARLAITAAGPRRPSGGLVGQMWRRAPGRSRSTEVGMSGSSAATWQVLLPVREWPLLYFLAVRAAKLIRRSWRKASDLRFLVGVAGFEPTASSSRTRYGSRS